MSSSKSQIYSSLSLNLTILCVIMLFGRAFTQSESDSCDWKRIEELGLIFKDTIGPKPLIVPDPDNPTIGIPNVTRSWVPEILRDDHFLNCLKGQRPEYFLKILGSTQLIPTTTSHNKTGYLLSYSMQEYDKNGTPLDPFPSSFVIEFDSEKKAIRMYTIAY